MEARRSLLALSCALPVLAACGDDVQPGSGREAGSGDSGLVDAEVLDAAADVDARAPVSADAAADAGLRDAAAVDAAVDDAAAADAAASDAAAGDAGGFTALDCAACTRELAPGICGAPNTVHWECLGSVNERVVLRLGAACADRGTALPRWCCAADFAPECRAP